MEVKQLNWRELKTPFGKKRDDGKKTFVAAFPIWQGNFIIRNYKKGKSFKRKSLDNKFYLSKDTGRFKYNNYGRYEGNVHSRQMEFNSMEEAKAMAQKLCFQWVVKNFFNPETRVVLTEKSRNKIK